MDTTKICWKCQGDPQSIENFARSGKDSVCKTCRYQLNAEWAKSNREKLRPKRSAYMRQYRAKKAEEAKKKAQEDTTPVVPPEPEKL